MPISVPTTLRAVARFAGAALTFAALTGCATTVQTSARQSALPAAAAESPTKASASTFGNRVAHAFRIAFVSTLQEDGSVGGGVLGSTVNEVVPIPGTDMIKVGVVQEGSLFQSSFRNPTEDASSRGGGTPTGATVVFRVFRP